MTPLSWGALSEKIQKALKMGIDNITADYSIIIGEKSGGRNRNKRPRPGDVSHN
jgi:hypothetical protein